MSPDAAGAVWYGQVVEEKWTVQVSAVAESSDEFEKHVKQLFF